MIVQSDSVGDDQRHFLHPEQRRTRRAPRRRSSAVVEELGAKEIVTLRMASPNSSIVGIGMRSHSGVAAKLFEALSAGGINIQHDLHQRDQNRGHH